MASLILSLIAFKGFFKYRDYIESVLFGGKGGGEYYHLMVLPTTFHHLLWFSLFFFS